MNDSFRRKQLPFPLTELCSKSGPSFVEYFVKQGDPCDELKRAKLLCYLVLYGAADFVNGSLDPEKTQLWAGSPSSFSDTNKDVLTAETVVWLCFLMGRLWLAERDYEMRERIGYLTLTQTNRLCLDLISETTGIDFQKGFIESRKLYLSAERERGDLHESFINRLLACFGRKSLADPLLKPDFLIPDATPLAIAVTLFFSTIPQSIYRSFTNLLREHTDKFPDDPSL